LRLRRRGGREVFCSRKICRLADFGIVGIDEVSDGAMARAGREGWESMLEHRCERVSDERSFRYLMDLTWEGGILEMKAMRDGRMENEEPVTGTCD